MKELVTFRKYLNEGVINEGVNLNDTLDTPEDLMKFITGGDESGQYGEAETILDDLTDVEGSVIGGETIWHNIGEFNQEEWDDERYSLMHFKEKYFDIDKPLTKKDVIFFLLNTALNDMDFHEDDDNENWEEEQSAAYELIKQKTINKYGFDPINR